MTNEVWIYGAGGIGCAIGYSLRYFGIRVIFVENNPLKVASGRKDGLIVENAQSVSAEFVSPGEYPPPANSVVLLCTKCYDNRAVLAQLPAGVILIPIQNGFDESLAKYPHRYEGVASFVSECERDRPRTRITRPGNLHLGKRQSTSSSGAHPLKFLMDALRSSSLFQLVEVERIEPFKFTKLMYNAAISPLAAAAGIDNGDLLGIPLARKLFFALLQENYRILAGSEIELGKIGPFRPKTVAWILRRRWLSALMARAFEPTLRGTYCSMASEIQKGRTEIDNYNGYLIELAKRAEVDCPLNRAVYSLVKRMTDERIEPSLEQLKELV